MKASDIFVKALEREGVEYIFGIPGEENLDLLESIRTSSIQMITTRHEQAAGFMAATYGRLIGRPGVCLSTLGPGAANLLTAAAYANLGGMPMLMITGQKPIKSSKQGRFQIIDVVQMMHPVTKFSKQIINGHTITAIIRDAVKTAMFERPGAVHLELPEDIASEDVEEIIYPVVPYRYPQSTKDSILDAVEMIESAVSPLILIGAGANRTRIGRSLTNMVNDTGIPFFSTQMGKGVVNENHKLCLGTAALSSNDFIHCAIDRADLIINIGHDVIEKPPFIMRPNGAKVIHINFSGSEIDETYFPQLDILGDIASNIDALNSAISPQEGWKFDYFKRVRLDTREHLDKYAKDDRFPLLPQRVVNIVQESMAADDIVTLDNGMYKIWFARNYRCINSNTMLLDNALATMGAGLPSAIAAKMVKSDKSVMAICGDGGFMMNSQELETAVRLELDIVVLILNDSGYGMIKWKQEGMKFTDYGLSYKNPDFVKYAESYGARGWRPDSCLSFKSILSRAISSKGVDVIDLSIDYSLNHAILNEVLKHKKCIL